MQRIGNTNDLEESASSAITAPSLHLRNSRGLTFTGYTQSRRSRKQVFQAGMIQAIGAAGRD